MSSLNITQAVFYTAVPIGGSRHKTLKTSLTAGEKGFEGWTMTYSNQALEIRTNTNETFIVPSIGIKFMRAGIEEKYSKTDSPVSNTAGKGTKKQTKG